MADNVIRYRATLTDNVSAGLKKIKAEAGMAGTGLGGAFTSAEKSLSRVSGALGHAKGAIGGLLTGPLGLLGLGGGFLAVGAAVSSGMEELKQYQFAQTQTAAVLKSTKGAANITAQGVTDLAKRMEDLTTTDYKAVQATENILLTFTGIKNTVGAGNDIFNQATLATLNMSRALGQDANKSAIQLGKALNDPVKGATALRRVGVMLTQQQQDQIKTLMKHNDLLGAQKIILGELNTEFGGSAAAAANTYEGQMNRLNDAVHELEMGFVQALLPGLTNVSKAMADLFKDPGTQKGISDLGKTIASWFSKENIASAGRFLGVVKDVFGGIIDGWNKLPEGVRQLLVGGFVANKATKFLFGFSLTDIAKPLVGGMLGQIGKMFLGRGSTPATPLFVADVTGGAGGLLGGKLGGILKGAMAFLPAAIAAAIAVQLGQQFLDQSRQIDQQGKDVVQQAKNWISNPTTSRTDRQNAINNIEQQKSDPLNWLALNVTNPFNHGLDHLNQTEDSLKASLTEYYHGQTTSAGSVGGSIRNYFHGQGKTDITNAVETGVERGYFKGAAAVRAKLGVSTSGEALRQYISGKAPIGTGADALVTARAVSDALVNALNAPGNEKQDLKSAVYELGKIKEVQKLLPKDMADKLAPKITALEAAIKKVKASVDAQLPTLKGILAKVGGSPNQLPVLPGHEGGPKTGSGVTDRKGGKASGGPVIRNRPVIVGEHGRPEVFVPESNGAIRNASSLGGSASELTLNVNVSSQNGVITPGAARDIAASLGPMIAIWMQRNGLMPRNGTAQRG